MVPLREHRSLSPVAQALADLNHPRNYRHRSTFSVLPDAGGHKHVITDVPFSRHPARTKMFNANSSYWHSISRINLTERADAATLPLSLRGHDRSHRAERRVACPGQIADRYAAHRLTGSFKLAISA